VQLELYTNNLRAKLNRNYVWGHAEKETLDTTAPRKKMEWFSCLIRHTMGTEVRSLRVVKLGACIDFNILVFIRVVSYMLKHVLLKSCSVL
jgi:hypothetical protein